MIRFSRIAFLSALLMTTSAEASRGISRPLCPSCGLVSATVPTITNQYGFTESVFDQGIAAWIPVDADLDGDWEIALSLSSSVVLGEQLDPKVGVFDPAGSRWVDGPHSLPTSGSNWGVSGSVESGFRYVHLVDSIVKLFDPISGLDSSLWRVDYTPLSLLLWSGYESNGPTVAILQNTSGGSDYSSSISYRWRVYELTTGALVTTLDGGQGRTCRIRVDRETNQDAISILACGGSTGDVPGPGLEWSEFWAQLKAYGKNWFPLNEISLPYFESNLHSWFTPQSLRSATSSWVSEESATLVWSTQPGCCGFGAPSYIKAAGRYNWLVSFSVSYLARNKSIAAYDLNEDGQDELLLPLNDGSGWEVRSVIDGQVADTLSGMPIVELSSGPFLSAHENTLFYVSGSSACILKPESSTGIFDEPQSEEPAPNALLVTASPNPFNGAISLTWTPGVSVSSISIHNILGQTIKTMDASAVEGSVGMTWDGRDDHGQPVASGVYIARLQSRAQSATTKIVLLR